MANATTLPASKHFTLQELAPGVYAAFVIENMGAFSNGGFVDLGDEVLVIDGFLTPQAARDLRQIAEEVTGHPVRYLVNTHWHGDHVRGNQVYADTSIISTRITRDLIATYLPERLKDMLEQGPAHIQALEAALTEAKDPAERRELENELIHVREVESTLATVEVTLPNITFEQKMTLHGTRRSAELITFGGGHSPSDVFVYLPDDKIMFMGDLLFVQTQPAFWNANEREWIEILERVEQFDAEQLVPGHGPLGGLADVTATKQYIIDLLDIIQANIESGGTEESISDLKLPAAYESWSFGALFHRNLQKLFAQLTQN